MKLKHGDYVSTKGMTDEQFNAVCRKFFNVGAGKEDHFNNHWRDFDYFGWADGGNDSDYACDGLFTFDDESSEEYFKRGRHLTVDQILGEGHKKTVQVVSEIGFEQLVHDINLSLDHDEVVEFIKMLELSYSDWGLTEQLADHFIEQMKLYNEESEEEDKYTFRGLLK